MSSRRTLGFPLHRRDVLKGGATLAGATLPVGWNLDAVAAASSTLVVAAPATPQSLDCNFDVSLGTFEAIAVLYGGASCRSSHVRNAPLATVGPKKAACR
jgi:hypothetical protein